ncbi:TIGR03085 family protein [Actinomadura craniellae]|uniref:TIGR03085 family protein n=1 Tax=Actinomadura craniellae TaxID=2231787 RepID=A0A365HBS2_9ACTN|nr:TIGR03085 family metal-binding protein [Actinomadura craniellae]RAY16489.1 TIGR03085 family protein [Actinomadura craniellae]
MDTQSNSGPAGSADQANPARAERRLLCDALVESGPEAPTLCAGWTTADLAAHLVVREGRPDTWPGMALRPLGFHTERVRRRTKRVTPFPQLVERIREGPPKWSLYALPGADKSANTVEYFVHHEDIRRAVPDWTPRELPPGLEEVLWRRLKIARFVLRKVSVEVTLVRPDGKTLRVGKGARAARVHGPIGELVLWALGRCDVAQVRFTGDAEAVEVLRQESWRL